MNMIDKIGVHDVPPGESLQPPRIPYTPIFSNKRLSKHMSRFLIYFLPFFIYSGNVLSKTSCLMATGVLKCPTDPEAVKKVHIDLWDEDCKYFVILIFTIKFV